MSARLRKPTPPTRRAAASKRAVAAVKPKAAAGKPKAAAGKPKVTAGKPRNVAKAPPAAKAKARPRKAAPAVPAPTVATARPAPVSAGRWPQLTARDVMRRNVITVDRATPLSEVERVLVEQKISGAPVTNETGAIVGVVSLRDLVERYVEDVDARPRRTRGYFHLSSEELEDEDYELTELPAETEETAEDVMTAEVYSVDGEAPLAEVARTMVEHRIHRVLVHGGGHFAGIVGSFEILQAFARAGDRGTSQGSPS